VSTPKKRSLGLGRGFDTLLPQDFDKSLIVEDVERIQKLDVAVVAPHANQPRQHFDQEALEQLAQSILAHGILQPLVVTPAGTGYVIIAGERRWRAAQIAGLGKVPAIVRTTKELEQLELALVENVQRVDLSPLEQAVSIERLHQQFSMTYDAIAKRLGKSVPAISNTVRLLQLPEQARVALQQKQITEGHARAILALKDLPEKQLELLHNILTHDWSVRQAERFVVSIKEGYQDTAATKQRMQTETTETKQLSKRIGAPVHIRRTARGGKLEIAFKNDDELTSILNNLQ
jgi:ParB family chromosome partitioning protein